MKKRIKKMLVFVIGLMGIMNICGITCLAEESSGNFTYTLSGTEATITGYYGSSSQLIIPSEIDGYVVTAIGKEAFAWYHCSSGFTYVKVPDTVKVIGEKAFFCQEIAELVLSDNISCIDDEAFSGCKNLSKINLPENLSFMGHEIIANTSITSITIPKNVKSCRSYNDYSWGPLARCSSLKEVYFEEGMEVVPAGICANIESYNNNIERVVLPNTVKSIGEKAFYYCRNLSDIELPDNLIEIGKEAFVMCNNLLFLKVPDSLEKIDNSFSDTIVLLFNEKTSFYDLMKKEEKNVTINIDCMQENHLYRYLINEDNTVSLLKYIGDEFLEQNSCPVIKIPDNIEGKKVIKISGDMFGEDRGVGYERVYSVVLPETIQIIGYRGFYNCNIVDVKMPSTMKYVGDMSFSNCRYIQTIEFPRVLDYMGESVCEDCRKLESVKLPENIVDIPSGTFSYCTNLSKIELPVSINQIGKRAFYRCESLQTIQFPDSLKIIEEEAFSECDLLKDIELPENLQQLGGEAFQNTPINFINIPSSLTVESSYYGSGPFEGCSCLKEINFEEGITKIDDYLFSGSGLEKITIPETVICIGEYAFEDCHQLKTIELSDNLKKIGFCAFRDSGIETIILPNSISQIGSGAFMDCSLEKAIFTKGITEVPNGIFSYCDKLKYVFLPDSITKIGDDAFFACSNLSEIFLPDNVTYIGDSAFKNCNNLVKTVIPQSVINIKNDAFENCDALIIYGYKDSYAEKYATTNNIQFVDNGLQLISSTGSLEITPNITVTSGETQSIALTIRADSSEKVTELLNSLNWESSDKNIAVVNSDTLSMINPSTWGNSVTIYRDVTGFIPGRTEITATVSDGSKVSCKVTVEIEKVAPNYTYKGGTLQSIDTNAMKVTISGTEYNVTDDFDMSGATAILNDKECKTVAMTLKNGYIAEIKSVEDIMNPSVRVEMNPNQITYSDGSYSNTDGTVTVVLSCDALSPYNTIDFSGLDVPTVQYTKLQLETSAGLYFEKKLLGGKVTSKEESLEEELCLGDSCSRTYDIHVDTSSAPARVTNSEYVNVSAVKNEETMNAQGVLSIGNLDIQNTKTEEGKEPSKSQTITSAKEELTGNGITFTLNPYRLGTYFDNTEIDKMEQCLDTWLSTIMAVSSIVDDEDDSFMTDFKKKHKLTTDDIMERVFAKMGINYNSMTNSRRYTANTTVIAKNKNGNMVNVEFSVKFSNYAFNKQKPYGSFGEISYSFKDEAGNAHTAFMGAGGAVTYSDLDGFIESVRDLTESNLKSFYKQFWGNDADKVAEMMTSETISKLMDKTVGSFSDNVFKLLEQPAKKCWYKMTNACPNDVYIYDSQGNLCGAIVNGIVDTDYDNFYMYVDGDEKCFYLMGEDYNIEYIGTDTGTMDLRIEAYFGEDLIRTIQYEDIPLEKDKTYESAVFENPYLDNVVYSPVSDSDEIVQSSLDSWQDNLKKKVYVKGITLDTTACTLIIGDIKQVNASILPADATYPMIEYQSDNDAIAKVDENGTVTALSVGNATITAATLDGNYKAQCTVTVTEVKESAVNPQTQQPRGNNSQTTGKQMTALKLSGISQKIAAGKKIKLSPAITPIDATDQTLTWTSSNPKYATVSQQGVVTTKKKGVGKSVTITATARDGSGITASYKIKIVKDAVKSIKLKAVSKSVKAGKKITVKATVKTTGKTANKALQWSSSNTKYATVSKKGVVTAKKAGKGKTVKITAMATDGTGKKAVIKVKIK